MTGKHAEILLASVFLARSTSFLFSKILLQTMEPFTLMAFRFLLSGLVLIIIFRKRFINISTETIKKGALLGLCYFFVMAAELFGLRTVSSSSAALLEGTAIVFVPIFECLLRKTAPGMRTVAGTVLSFLGVALLTSDGSGFNMGVGELLCLAAAVIYAAAMILTDRITEDSDSVVLGTLQVTVIGLLGTLSSFIFETPQAPSGSAQWGSLLFLIVVCSIFGSAMQPLAQKYTTSERTAVMSALNPMGAALLGIVFLHESVGALGLVGSALIVSSLFVQSSQNKQLPEL